eukprot:3191116-Pleurochrysis_carterae.AAC.2
MADRATAERQSEIKGLPQRHAGATDAQAYARQIGYAPRFDRTCCCLNQVGLLHTQTHQGLKLQPSILDLGVRRYASH